MVDDDPGLDVTIAQLAAGLPTGDRRKVSEQESGDPPGGNIGKKVKNTGFVGVIIVYIN